MFDLIILELLFSPWEMVEVVAVAVFFANGITVCLPNKVDNKYGQFVIDVLNTLSMNILQNANRLYPKRFKLPKQQKKKKKKKSAPPKVGGRSD